VQPLGGRSHVSRQLGMLKSFFFNFNFDSKFVIRRKENENFSSADGSKTRRKK